MRHTRSTLRPGGLFREGGKFSDECACSLGGQECPPLARTRQAGMPAPPKEGGACPAPTGVSRGEDFVGGGQVVEVGGGVGVFEALQAFAHSVEGHQEEF